MGFWEDVDVAAAWRRMLTIRRFEEAMLQNGDQFPGHRHVAIGQEATAVAVMAALDGTDPVMTNHRNHGHNLARGADPTAMLAEIFGKETGISRGKSGTFHISDPEHNVLSASAIVTGGFCVSLGVALAARHKGEERVCAAFIGDGSMDEGGFHETMNLAGLWSVPLLVVCENNSGSADPRESGLSGPAITQFATNYGIAATRVDGTDPAAVYEAVKDATAVMRRAARPWFLETVTMAWPGNATGWPLLVDGKTTAVADAFLEAPKTAWDGHDPVLRFARQAVAKGKLTREAVEAADRQVSEEMAAAVRGAIEAPYPKPEDALEDVWA